jgi:aminoglycoside phosphotransferase family enzyme
MESIQLEEPGRISIDEEIAFLSSREAWPERPRAVEVVETHLSWVFLTERYAYKIKKPVVFDVVDYRTVEARRVNAFAEVALNLRLAKEVYLGVVPLVVRDDRSLAVGDAGTVVDWLVQMRRLPDEALLDGALRAGPVDVARVRPVAQVLSVFYRNARPVGLSPGAYRAYLLGRIEENERALQMPVAGLAVASVRSVCAELGAVVDSGRLDPRAERVVEGHGDLRPEHVCLVPPVVIDCLEFDRRLRLRDPADEISQLAAGLDTLGAPDLGRVFLWTYGEVTGDWPDPEVLSFYRRNAALVKARLAAWRLAGDARDRARLLARVRDSFRVATREGPRAA